MRKTGMVLAVLLAFVVRAQATEAPFICSPPPIPAVIQAEDYDIGSEGVAYHDTTSANLGGSYRTDGVDIEPTTDTGGGYDVGYITNGEWLKYTVNAITSGSYSVDIRVASIYSTGAFHLEIDGVNVSGTVHVPSTRGWQNWTTVTVHVGAVTTGTHVVREVSDSGKFNINWFTFNCH